MYSSSYSGYDGDEGLVFQPLFCMVSINGSYLVCLCERLVQGIYHDNM